MGDLFPSMLRVWMETIDNIPRLTPREKVYKYLLGKDNIPLILLPEQKSLAFMVTLVEKYHQPGVIVYDPFAGSYATGLACLLLPLHRLLHSERHG